eukprot:CAMPEP_0115554068 /NCGR_PEP_ID=MMETSP0271-20121206/97101_1 /TAXON_ID=71861 /ORGANISM="Scrippsiella trochoidea, Strain CCMP3099" /LENGTH=114 /DNA_ID=CAMNT_0002987779 /DNA_START=218 /DNA_END=562 /DNA_ORIENTATION=-
MTTDPKNAGANTKSKCSWWELLSSEKINAVAPPGGCTVLVNSCATMVRDTLSAPLNQKQSSKPMASRRLTTATPTKPPSVLPPIVLKGCATGALIALKRITDIAPKAATRRLSI